VTASRQSFSKHSFATIWGRCVFSVVRAEELAWKTSGATQAVLWQFSKGMQRHPSQS
jgi:hypothetical protein